MHAHLYGPPKGLGGKTFGPLPAIIQAKDTLDVGRKGVEISVHLCADLLTQQINGHVFALALIGPVGPTIAAWCAL